MNSAIKAMKTFILIFALLSLSGCGGEPARPTAIPFSPTATNIPVKPTETGTPTLEPTETLTAVPTACSLSAMLVTETIPDGSIMRPGQAFVKTWTVMNTGTCTWDASYRLINTSASYACNTKWVGEPVQFSDPISPGQETDLIVNFIAPEQPGEYKSCWSLQDSGHNLMMPYFVAIIRIE